MIIQKRKIRVLDKDVLLIRILRKKTKQKWKIKSLPGINNEEGD